MDTLQALLALLMAFGFSIFAGAAADGISASTKLQGAVCLAHFAFLASATTPTRPWSSATFPALAKAMLQRCLIFMVPSGAALATPPSTRTAIRSAGSPMRLCWTPCCGACARRRRDLSALGSSRSKAAGSYERCHRKVARTKRLSQNR